MVGERDRAVWEGEELKAANLRVGAGRDGECWVCMLSEVEPFLLGPEPNSGGVAQR